MKKLVVAAAFVGVLAVLIPLPSRGEGEEASPEEMYRKAYLLEREGMKALYGEDLPAAYDSLAGALAIYEEIARVYPDWRTSAIGARISGVRSEADAVGRKIFSLPEGMLEIEPGMTREGRRYDEGRALAGKVEAAGEGEYEVDSFTVSVIREGPLLGAACTCPDFTYRGRKHNFACKHIWAVVIREKMLE